MRDDVFADLPQMREWLRMLRTRGASIRLTGCGTRFFAIAGHAPLAVDQAVLAVGLLTDSLGALVDAVDHCRVYGFAGEVVGHHRIFVALIERVGQRFRGDVGCHRGVLSFESS